MKRILGTLKKGSVRLVVATAEADCAPPVKKRGRGGPPHYTVDQMLAALLKHKGCLHLAAKQLGCSRSTVQNYCARYPELLDAAAQARESVLDKVEFKLYQKAEAGDRACMFFLLKTQGKSRGYSERGEPPVQHDLSVLTDEELIALGPILRKLQAAAAGPPPSLPLALVPSSELLPE